MRLIKKNWQKIILTAYVFLAPVISFAQGDIPSPDCKPGTICNPLGANGPDSIPSFIKVFLEGALKVGIPLVALAVIYCGFLFVEARGNSEKLEKAKDSLLYTLIGASILLGSWAIAELISSTVISLGK